MSLRQLKFKPKLKPPQARGKKEDPDSGGQPLNENKEAPLNVESSDLKPGIQSPPRKACSEVEFADVTRSSQETPLVSNASSPPTEPLAAMSLRQLKFKPKLKPPQARGKNEDPDSGGQPLNENKEAPLNVESSDLKPGIQSPPRKACSEVEFADVTRSSQETPLVSNASSPPTEPLADSVPDIILEDNLKIENDVLLGREKKDPLSVTAPVHVPAIGKAVLPSLRLLKCKPNLKVGTSRTKSQPPPKDSEASNSSSPLHTLTHVNESSGREVSLTFSPEVSESKLGEVEISEPSTDQGNLEQDVSKSHPSHTAEAKLVPVASVRRLNFFSPKARFKPTLKKPEIVIKEVENTGTDESSPDVAYEKDKLILPIRKRPHISSNEAAQRKTAKIILEPNESDSTMGDEIGGLEDHGLKITTEQNETEAKIILEPNESDSPMGDEIDALEYDNLKSTTEQNETEATEKEYENVSIENNDKAERPPPRCYSSPKSKSQAVYGSKSIRSYLGSSARPKLTNRSKRPFAPSTYGKMCFEVRQEYEKKFGENEPDPSKMTMLELIFCKSKNKPGPRPKNKETKDPSSEELIDDPPERVDTVIDLVDHEDKNSAADRPLLSDSIHNREESEQEGDAPVPVPQLKLTADGKVVIAEESLVVKQSKGVISDNIEEITDERFKKVKKNEGSRTGWSHSETLKFYEILNKVGADFGTMNDFFPERSRKNLKCKFKREERLRGKLIDKVMSHPSEYILKETADELEADIDVDKTIECLGRNLQKPKKNVDWSHAPFIKRKKKGPGALSNKQIREILHSSDQKTVDCDDNQSISDSKKGAELKQKKRKQKEVATLNEIQTEETSKITDENEIQTEDTSKTTDKNEIILKGSRFKRAKPRIPLRKEEPVKYFIPRDPSPESRLGEEAKEPPSPLTENPNIVISTNFEYDHLKMTQYITYNSDNLENPIEINATISHENEAV